MWYYNKTVNSTFVHYATQWAWADIAGLGWKRIRDGAADGCTNLFLLLSAARANNRQVHVDVDDSTGLIQTAYLI